MINFFSGITQYVTFLADKKIQSNEYVIRKQTQLDQVSDGYLYDTVKFEQKLNQLNDLIACANQKFSINAGCATCINMQVTQTYDVPACVQNREQVTQGFMSLKNSLNSSKENVKNMNQELIFKDNSVLNNRIQVRDQLLNTKPNFDSVMLSLNNTKTVIDQFTIPFDQAYDLRIV